MPRPPPPLPTAPTAASFSSVPRRSTVERAKWRSVVETILQDWTLSVRVPGWCDGATAWLGHDEKWRSSPVPARSRMTRVWGPAIASWSNWRCRLESSSWIRRIDAVRGSTAIERGRSSTRSKMWTCPTASPWNPPGSRPARARRRHYADVGARRCNRSHAGRLGSERHDGILVALPKRFRRSGGRDSLACEGQHEQHRANHDQGRALLRLGQSGRPRDARLASNPPGTKRWTTSWRPPIEPAPVDSLLTPARAHRFSQEYAGVLGSTRGRAIVRDSTVNSEMRHLYREARTLGRRPDSQSCAGGAHAHFDAGDDARHRDCRRRLLEHRLPSLE